MVPVKNIRFDCFLNRIKVQNQKQLFDALAQGLSGVSRADADLLSDLMRVRRFKSDDNTGEGISIIDLKSSAVIKPALLIATLQSPLDMGASDHKPVDVVCVVLSTGQCGTSHLQRLARVSRLLRLYEFCDSLRECEDVDAMRVLFMPDQKWARAA